MNEKSKTHWKKIINPNYLGSWDFQPNEKRLLTIKSVGMEQIRDIESKNKEFKNCIVAYFEEDCKPMIMNKTNCKTIQKILKTPIIEEWVKKQVYINTEKVSAFGGIHEALRVVSEIPTKQTTVTYNCQDCNATNIDPKVAEYAMKTLGVTVCAECGKLRKGEQKC